MLMEMTIELERTRDILGSARGEMGFSGVLVGFAAETEDLEANALAKLEAKGCDFVVANDVSRSDIGFDSAENEIVVLFPEGRVERPPRAEKTELAKVLLMFIEDAAKEKVG